jgi:colanic acid/amylovoran biosynthesis glycosyltransferase
LETMKNIVLFITNHAPYTGHERFLCDEFVALHKIIPEMIMVPLNPKGVIIHDVGKTILDSSECVKLTDPRIYTIGTVFALLNLRRNCFLVTKIVCGSGSARNVVKNILALFKANYLAYKFKRLQFVYAHWASGPSSLGYFLSVLRCCPFAFVAHRGDIKEDNLLAVKVRAAAFIRVIASLSRKMLVERIHENGVPEFALIPMGVSLPSLAERPLDSFSDRKSYTILLPALFYEVKGHIFAIEAVELLRKKRSDFTLVCAGDGPIFKFIMKIVYDRRLDNCVQLLGLLPAEKMDQLTRQADIVILPSINDSQGNHEGVPVSLMEAMAYGIPVIGTSTGGIAELLENAGILIPEKDSGALASAIEKLLASRETRESLGQAGRKRVEERYSLDKNVSQIAQLIRASS